MVAQARLQWPNAVSVALLGILAVSTAWQATPVAAKEQVRIAGFTWPGYGFWIIAQEKGLAPDLDLIYTPIENPYDSFNLMASGNLDVISSTNEFAPIATSSNMPVRLVAFGNLSYGTDKLIMAPEIREPADLKGKQVAVLIGGVAQIYMGIWLEQNGLSIEDVKLVNVIADAALAAMVSGEVAAAQFWEPYGANALKALPGAHVMAQSREEFWLQKALMADAHFMAADFIHNRRAVAVETMRALYKAIDWYRENPAEGNQIIANGLKMALADVELVLGTDGTGANGGLYVYSFVETARFCGVAPGDPPFGQRNGQIYAQWRLFNEWWIKFGEMKEQVPAARGIDCSLLRELYETGFAGEPDPNF